MSDQSDSNIVKLHEFVGEPAGPQPEVIALLEKYLQWAKEGDITGIAIAATRANHMAVSPDWACFDMQSGFVLLGAVSRLQWAMHSGQDKMPAV